MLPEWFDLLTNAQFTGGSRTGKTKLAEHCMREHTIKGNGYLFLDYHGTGYEAMRDFLAYLQPDQPVVLLNPSNPTHIRTFDPFRKPEGVDLSTHATRLAYDIVKVWGADPRELPTYRRIVRMVIAFCAVAREPLHHGAMLLELPKKELREYAVSLIEDRQLRNQWAEFQYMHRFQDWKHEVESTANRLDPFVGSKTIKLFTGLPGPTESVDDWIQKKAIVLVNLKPSDHLSEEASQVFASLLLSEFMHAAIRNTDVERPYFLYLDEAANYVTLDVARMLDQTLKSGLRTTLIYHHVVQFPESIREHMAASLDMNAKIKAVFSGVPLAGGKALGEEFFIHESNERWKKEDRFQYVPFSFDEGYETITNSEGKGPGGPTSSHSVTTGMRSVPSYLKERVGQEDFTREDKLAKLAARFGDLKQRECYLKFPGEEALKYEVPWVEEYLLNSTRVIQFEKALHKDSIPLHEAEIILKEAETRFLARGKDYESKGKERPRKKRPLSPQQ